MLKSVPQVEVALNEVTNRKCMLKVNAEEPERAALVITPKLTS